MTLNEAEREALVARRGALVEALLGFLPMFTRANYLAELSALNRVLAEHVS